jgi:quinol monooxygenase YgiN
VVKEAGFRQQYITISHNDPNHVLLFEAWDNAAAHAAHVATDCFKKYQATTGNMIAKRNVRTFSSVAMLSP